MVLAVPEQNRKVKRERVGPGKGEKFLFILATLCPGKSVSNSTGEGAGNQAHTQTLPSSRAGLDMASSIILKPKEPQRVPDLSFSSYLKESDLGTHSGRGKDDGFSPFSNFRFMFRNEWNGFVFLD